MKDALAVMQKIAASVRDLMLPTPPNYGNTLRAEAYAYHREWADKNPDLYQPETLARIRSSAGITAVEYIQNRRELALARREIEKVFDSADVLVTPTTPISPATVEEAASSVENSRSITLSSIRNTTPFDIYGIPTISVPCGFTQAGLPIGLQISGPHGGEAVVLQLAHAYEQATEWHKRRPSLSA